MNIELNVPIMTPIIIANEKLRMLSPPRMKMARSTISVDTDVLTVRARVSLMELLKLSSRFAFGCRRRFSRIRSMTTTESLTS